MSPRHPRASPASRHRASCDRCPTRIAALGPWPAACATAGAGVWHLRCAGLGHSPRATASPRRGVERRAAQGRAGPRRASNTCPVPSGDVWDAQASPDHRHQTVATAALFAVAMSLNKAEKPSPQNTTLLLAAAAAATTKNFPGFLQRVITKDCSSAARCHGATLDSNCLPFEPASSGIHYIN